MITKMKNIAIELGLIEAEADGRKYIDDFESEMLRGLAGEKSSLLMLPTYISQEELRFSPGYETISADNEKVIVIDAGGTNLRIALVELGTGAPKIVYFNKYLIPGFGAPVSVEEFFDKLAEYLKPIITESDRIGFCFSNPAEILPDRDARIITFTKEVVVTGSEGVLLGESLNAALRSRGLPYDKRIVVLNDTVATQLSAMSDSNVRAAHSGFIGLILGTGINASYSEANEFIKKSDILCQKTGTTIINTEAGGYDGFPQNMADARFIQATGDPEYHKFEKMASGGYQNKLLLEWIGYAAEKGAFSTAFSKKAELIEHLPIEDIGRFYTSSGDNILSDLCTQADDLEKMRQMIEAFYDRIGFMTAAVLTGMLKRMGNEGKTPERPVCISAEGSTFYKAVLLRSAVIRYMNRYARGEFGYYYEFMRIEDATILGSAAAGLVK